MAGVNYGSSVGGPTIVKQEPIEADLPVSVKREVEYVCVKEETSIEADLPVSVKREVEYVCVKEETSDWETPYGHSSAQDPLSIIKKDWETPNGHSSAQDPLSVIKKEPPGPDEDGSVNVDEPVTQFDQMLQESCGNKSFSPPLAKRKKVTEGEPHKRREGLCSDENSLTEAVQSLQQIADQASKRNLFEYFSHTVYAYLQDLPLEVTLESQTEILNYLVKQKKMVLLQPSSPSTSSDPVCQLSPNIIIEA